MGLSAGWSTPIFNFFQAVFYLVLTGASASILIDLC